jgi:acetoin utilization protein AcuB
MTTSRTSARAPLTSIEQVMTPSPHTIGADQSLATALAMMQAFGVRHLPVRDNGRLVGLVTFADVRALAKDAHHRYSCVRLGMSRDPVVVPPDAPLLDVVTTMNARNVDVAIVKSGDVVVGIFTAVDVARLYAAHLEAPARAG